MKFFFILFFSSFFSFLSAQEVIPFVDFNRWFRTVEEGIPKFIEMQEIKGYKAGDYLVAYIDIRGNLCVYEGQKKHTLSNMIELYYKISDKIVAWNNGQTLNMWSKGKKKVLTFFADDTNYVVKDDIVVYTDLRYNSLMVHWNGSEYPLQTSTIDIVLINSHKIGENILAYADNGGLYKIFYNGEIYDVGQWNGDIDIKSGTNIAAFNDPNSRTFAVFDKGVFLDIENEWVKTYKTGRGFVVYEDQIGNLMIYRNGQKYQLSSFPGTWDVVDDIVVYENNGYTYCDVNGTTTQAATFKINDYKIKNATLVYRNMNGGITAVIDGKSIELTNMQQAEFDIYGNSVLIKLLNNNFLVYQQGKLTRI